MNDSVPAISVKNLGKRFGTLTAVNGVSFEVNPGSVVGFVGSNGAGKTTTMRILATLDVPSWGEAYIGGVNVVEYPSKIRGLLGWMPDDYGSYPNMTVVEYLDFFARAHGFKKTERLDRVEDVMDFTELTPLHDRFIDKLSKGQKQRLCLGRALIHDPEVLIMDEPAAGLDPKARVELKNLIRLLAQDGKTIFISSHILSELGEMCDSLLFINEGKVIHHGDSDDLTQESETEGAIISVELANGADRLEEWTTMVPNVEFRDGTRRGGRITIPSATREEIAAVLRRMISDGLEVSDFHREEKRLEDAFIEIVSGKENSK